MIYLDQGLARRAVHKSVPSGEPYALWALLGCTCALLGCNPAGGTNAPGAGGRAAVSGNAGTTTPGSAGTTPGGTPVPAGAGAGGRVGAAGTLGGATAASGSGAGGTATAGIPTAGTATAGAAGMPGQAGGGGQGSGGQGAGGLGGVAAPAGSGAVGGAAGGPAGAGSGGIGGNAGAPGPAGAGGIGGGPAVAGSGGIGGAAGGPPQAGFGGVGGMGGASGSGAAGSFGPVDPRPGARHVNQLFIRHGLQLGVWVGTEELVNHGGMPHFIVNPNDWDLSGFTGPTFFGPPLWNPGFMAARPFTQWSLAQAPVGGHLDRGPSQQERDRGFLGAEQLSRLHQLTVMLFGDEEGYSPAMVTYLRDWYEVTRKHYPNVLVHNNQWVHQWTDQQLREYIQTAKPDLITYDRYLFNANRPSTYRGSKDMAWSLYKYRSLAFEGIDGNGAEPIQFGQFTQGYRMDGNYTITESQLRLYYYLTWTFGSRWLNWFRWLQGNDEGMGSQPTTWAMLLQDGLPTMPTEVMGWVNQCNRESLHLGPYLVRLKSTDVRYLPGEPGATDGSPLIVPQWGAGADPYITSISGSLLGAEQTGKRADIFVGYFKVIPAGEGGDPGFFRDPNAEFFMVANAFTSAAKTAHEASQRITLELDLGGQPRRFLKEIDRATGTAQLATVVPLGGQRFRLSTDLPGGTAALYMVTTTPN